MMRAIIRVKTLPTGVVNGHFTRKLNTMTSTDASVCSESKQSVNSHEGGSELLKQTADGSVSYLHFANIHSHIQSIFILTKRTKTFRLSRPDRLNKTVLNRICKNIAL